MRSLLPKAKYNVAHLKCAPDFKSKNLFGNIEILIVCIPLKQTDILCQQKEEKNLYNIMVFPFLETPMYFYLWQTLTYIDQNMKKKISWLPPGCQSSTKQLSHQNSFRLGLLHLNFSLSCSLCLPPFALLSFHFRKQLFLHKLQSYSQQHVQHRQIACGCPGTSHFIFAQTQHGLPGTTSVTRTPASPSCQQPSQRQDAGIDTLRLLDSAGRFCTSCCSH